MSRCDHCAFGIKASDLSCVDSKAGIRETVLQLDIDILVILRIPFREIKAAVPQLVILSPASAWTLHLHGRRPANEKERTLTTIERSALTQMAVHQAEAGVD